MFAYTEVWASGLASYPPARLPAPCARALVRACNAVTRYFEL